MYLYNLQIGDAVQSLDQREWGYITAIEPALIDHDGHGDDVIYFRTARGEISSYKRWMVRRIKLTDASAPPF